MSVDACIRCQHADCCMERGDVLPPVVDAAYWPDGTRYVPSAAAQARHVTLERAREQAAEMEAAIAQADVLRVLDRVTSSTSTAATTTPGTSSQDSEPGSR